MEVWDYITVTSGTSRTKSEYLFMIECLELN